ncbi:MAG: AAA family ATPase [Alphaproteobacteria bacterium]|nr:AAA family ATPase [Alphaproteobacteria bacterium]
MTARYDIQLDKKDKSAHFAYILLQQRPELGKAFEKNFNVTFGQNRGGKLSFETEPANEQNVRNGFNTLLRQFAEGTFMTRDHISAASRKQGKGKSYGYGNDNNLRGRFDNSAGRPYKQHTPYKFEARTEGQSKLIEAIEKNDVTFGLGPAGTGKTHVAIVKAVEMLKSGEIEKILLARPAQEAGEKLGYLPGDQRQKLDPYMRPLYDELTKVIGAQNLDRMMEDGTIELVPVGLMRGRTFENAFVIVDEAQNCTREQTKMALTRLGEGSRMVLTGDPQQTDIVNDSGLLWASEKLKGVEGIGYVTLTKVVRHPTVQRIVDALEGKSEEPAAAPSVPKKKPDAPQPPK